LVKPRVGTDIIVYTPAEAAHMRENFSFVQEVFQKGRVVYDREVRALLA